MTQNDSTHDSTKQLSADELAALNEELRLLLLTYPRDDDGDALICYSLVKPPDARCIGCKRVMHQTLLNSERRCADCARRERTQP